MGNLRDKNGKFASQKQLESGESISCSCFCLYSMIDTRGNSDLAKTKIVTSALKNYQHQKCVQDHVHMRGIYPGKCGNG